MPNVKCRKENAMTHLFWGAGLERTTGGEIAAAGAAQARAEQASRNVQQLEDRLDRLTLINMALWSFLKESANLTEEDLMNRVQRIDLSDGVADGKAKRQIAKCPKCDRTMSPRHKRCLYCGAEKLDYTAFDAVR
jgi:ribosomal protein S27AE